MSDYTTFRGKRCCTCVAEWMPVFERYLLHLGVIKHNVDIYQLTGTASASAGTHSKGGAFDLVQATLTTIRAARDGGADASWKRTPQQGFSVLHLHGVLRGCPHNEPARYQIVAVDDGYNGLGLNGRGGKDDGPRPLKKRTYREGMAWMEAQMQVPTPKPPAIEAETVFDHGHWNVASMKPGWFPVAWKDRQAGIGKQLVSMDCSVITLNETHFSEQTRDILAALGPKYTHVSSPIGNDIMFDHALWKQTRDFREYDLGAQNRKAGVLHLERIKTGQRMTIVNTHLPYASASLRSTAAANLVSLLADIDDPIILAGDFNNESFSPTSTPHGRLRRAGYEFLREQVKIVNATQEEFPSKRQWLSDIATDRDRKNGAARIVAGQLYITSPKLSDHRPIKARILVK